MAEKAAEKEEELEATGKVTDSKAFEDAFNDEAEKKDGTLPAEPQEKDPDKKPEPDPDKAAAKVDEGKKTDDEDPAAIEAARVAEEEAKQFEGWPKDAVERFKKQEEVTAGLEHKLSSDSGRVGAFQRKVNELEKTITKLTARKDQPSKEEITEAMKTEEGWKKIEEDYPEIAKPIAAKLEALQKLVDTKLAPVIESQENIAVKVEETAQKEAVDEVAKIYPGWQNAFFGNDVATKEFNDWKATQPPGVQALGNSTDPEDALILIGRYDDHRVAKGFPTIKANPIPGVDDNQGNEDGKGKSDELAEKRKQQLEDGTSVKSKSAQIDPDGESDGEFADAFNAFAARLEAKSK